jgi:hypothetical protein
MFILPLLPLHGQLALIALSAIGFDLGLQSSLVAQLAMQWQQRQYKHQGEGDGDQRRPHLSHFTSAKFGRRWR